GNRRDKSIIEFDPEIEKTLKKNRSRVKAQRNLQFEQEEVNSEALLKILLKKSVLKKRSKTIWQTIISGELLRIILILLLLVVEAVLFGPM
ncbi:hypothetical protein PIB30_101452, partial [Stylosanthes scabra]|nr:hypothetical protein [Stylosanthes scabra]